MYTRVKKNLGAVWVWRSYHFRGLERVGTVRRKKRRSQNLERTLQQEELRKGWDRRAGGTEALTDEGELVWSVYLCS